MIINISNNNLIHCFYCYDNKKINVFNYINKFIKLEDIKTINCDLFKIYNKTNKNNKLILKLKDNKIYEIYENEKVLFKKDKIEILNKKEVEIKKMIKPKIQKIDNKKYNYILSTNVRDEKNILEFILYHLIIGFDKIFIIDHLSKNKVSDQIKYLPVEYIEKIEVLYYDKEGSHKMSFLNNIIIPYMKKNCNEYFIHLDGDEYINLNNNFNNINELLNHYNSPDILLLNWVLFGSNNKKTNDNKYNCLIPTFIKCDNKVNKHFKIIINKNILKQDIKFINPHQIISNNNDLIYTNVNNHKLNVNSKINIMNIFNKFNIQNDISNLKCYINHYFIQSHKDYNFRKVNRNRDDIKQTRKFDNNQLINYNNIINDTLIKYSSEIESILDLKYFGFIILRCVKNKKNDLSWIKSYNSIRKFYDNKILIIDDFSDKEFLSNIELKNTFIINSEFKGRGELLPYYYYLSNKFCDRIVVLHDSMYIKKHTDFNNIKNFNNFTRIFSFPNACYNIDIKYFNLYCKNINDGNKIYEYHIENIKKLIGCFGVCYVINYNFLKKINDKYNITNLVKVIDTREKRKTLERFFSCLFEYEYKSDLLPDLLGTIFQNLKKNKDELIIEKKFFGR